MLQHQIERENFRSFDDFFPPLLKDFFGCKIKNPNFVKIPFNVAFASISKKFFVMSTGL